MGVGYGDGGEMEVYLKGTGCTKVWKKGKLFTLRAVRRGGLFGEMRWPRQGRFHGPGVAAQWRSSVVVARCRLTVLLPAWADRGSRHQHSDRRPRCVLALCPSSFCVSSRVSAFLGRTGTLGLSPGPSSPSPGVDV